MAESAALGRQGSDRTDHGEPKWYADKQRHYDAANTIQVIVCLCVRGAIVDMAG